MFGQDFRRGASDAVTPPDAQKRPTRPWASPHRKPGDWIPQGESRAHLMRRTGRRHLMLDELDER